MLHPHILPSFEGKHKDQANVCGKLLMSQWCQNHSRTLRGHMILPASREPTFLVYFFQNYLKHTYVTYLILYWIRNCFWVWFFTPGYKRKILSKNQVFQFGHECSNWPSSYTPFQPADKNMCSFGKAYQATSRSLFTFVKNRPPFEWLPRAGQGRLSYPLLLPPS